MRRGVLLLTAVVAALCWSFAPIAVGATVAQTDGSSTTVTESASTVRDDPASDRLRQVTYGLLGLGGVLVVGTLLFWRATRPPLVATVGAAGTVVPAEPTPESPTQPVTRRRAARDPAPEVAAPAGRSTGGGKISAAAFLATPPGSPASVALGGAPVAAVGGAAGLAAAAAATVAAGTAPARSDDELAPPVGAPAIDAPAPLDDIPLGAPKRLVGNDSAWLIEPERASGLIASPPTAGDFPEPPPAVDTPVTEPAAELPADPAADPAAELAGLADGPRDGVEVDRRAAADPDGGVDVIDVTGTDRSEADGSADAAASTGAGAVSSEPDTPVSPLFAALASLPDHEPVRIRFDDPPVERARRRSDTPPAGAPGFDRIARETANQPAIDLQSPRPAADDRRREGEPDRVAVDSQPSPQPTPQRARREGAVDDMALIASALSALPARDPDPVVTGPETDPSLPPVGVFYDQDLDPDDRAGRA